MRKFNKKLELCLKWKMFQTIFGSKFLVTSLAIKLPTGCKFAILHNIHYVNSFYHLIAQCSLYIQKYMLGGLGKCTKSNYIYNPISTTAKTLKFPNSN